VSSPVQDISSDYLKHNVRPDVSVEQVAALSSQNTLPEPQLDLDSLPPSLSTFPTSTANYRQNSGPPPLRSPAPAYTSDDPWSTARYNIAGPSGAGPNLNGITSSFSGSGMPKEWWKKQEKATVTILGHQGFILNRYMVYELSTEVREVLVSRIHRF
jgi:sorting nexin-8